MTSKEGAMLSTFPRTASLCLVGLVVLSVLSYASPIPKEEVAIINKVADEYNLKGEKRTLLFVIRLVENGTLGREFGVLSPEAMRYKNDPDWRKSFTTQARWAAGTIKKRYTDLESFSARWCPVGADNDPKGLNKNWLPNARYWMTELKKEGI